MNMNRLVAHLALAWLACTPPALAASQDEELETPRWWDACTMADPAEYRPADASDYGDMWSLWMRGTGAGQPWRAEADFNGDGLIDVAWVALHRQQRGTWMVGVDFGRKDGAPCRFAQLASLEDFDRLPGLLVWPKDESSLLCHAGDTLHATRCSAPADTRFAERDAAALLMVDRQGLGFSVHINQWVRADASHPLLLAPTDKDDPRAIRRFLSHTPERAIDWVESKRLQDAMLPKTHETPDVLRVAFSRLYESPHFVRFGETGVEGQPMHIATELHFEAPDRFLEIQRGEGVLREALMIGDRTWIRADGSAWRALPVGMKGLVELPKSPQLVSPATVTTLENITVLRAPARNGFGEFDYEAKIETSNGRLLSERADFGGEGQNWEAGYDYSKAPPIPSAPIGE